MATPDPHFRTDPARLAGFGIAIAVHALLIGFLVSFAPTRDALISIAPLMVQLIKPELPAPLTPKPEPRIDKLPKPLPIKNVQPRPEPESPVLAAQAQAAEVPTVVVSSEPKPLPPVEVWAASPAPLAPPAPIVPPNFNAGYLDNPAPLYPPLARRMGEEGRVMLRVYVEASGLPSKVEIRTSSGSERLDQAAVDAVKRWKFAPARQGDHAVPASVVVPIAFSLKG